MYPFKKILISLKAQINNVVDDFENHEALAALAIEEIEKIGRNSRIQLNRIRNRISELENKISALKLDAEKWSERAVKLEATDRESALNCVKRLKEAQKQIEILSLQQQKTIAQETKISADLVQISEQIGALRTRREDLISRQNLAKAKGKAATDGPGPARDANAIFERWESRVVGDEFEIPCEAPNDPFAERFETEEQDADLNATLAMLVEQSRKS
jgi:phage shock protein A